MTQVGAGLAERGDRDTSDSTFRASVTSRGARNSREVLMNATVYSEMKPHPTRCAARAEDGTCWSLTGSRARRKTDAGIRHLGLAARQVPPRAGAVKEESHRLLAAKRDCPLSADATPDPAGRQARRRPGPEAALSRRRGEPMVRACRYGCLAAAQGGVPAPDLGANSRPMLDEKLELALLRKSISGSAGPCSPELLSCAHRAIKVGSTGVGVGGHSTLSDHESHRERAHSRRYLKSESWCLRCNCRGSWASARTRYL